MPSFPLFSSPITAMRSQSVAMQTIGDNIANINTEGYKAARTSFASIVAGKNNGGSLETLAGARPFTQIFAEKEGGYEQSVNDLDVAIQGKGFFITNTSTNPADLASGSFELTDNGRFAEFAFQPDTAATATATTEELYLVDNKGNFVLGWPFNAATSAFDVDLTGTGGLQPIQLNQGSNTIISEATTAVDITANLDASTATGAAVDIGFTVHDGTEIPNLTNGVQGVLAPTSRAPVFTFTKDAANNSWTVTGAATNGTITSPAFPLTLTFDETGRSPNFGGAGSTLTLAVTWTNPAATTSTTVDFADLTSFGGETFVESNESNGFPQGIFENAFITNNGVVAASFTNGLTRNIAQIAMADVTSANLMEPVSGTHFRPTLASGDIQLFDFTTTSRASFLPNAFETSTTNVEQEFTNLIITQRSYSSAATALRTVDEMTRTASDLKN